MRQFFLALERKLAPYAIPQLGLILAVLQAAMWFLLQAKAELWGSLALNGVMVLQGEYYRLFSFLMLPSSMGFLELLGIYFFYFMSTVLEARWGALRVNLYLGISWLASIAICFLSPQLALSSFYLDSSLFLAFAWLYPDFQLLIFFIIPVKAKYIALITWIFYLLTLAQGSWEQRLVVLAAVSNFVIFFGRDVWNRMWSGRARMERNFAVVRKDTKPFHRCQTCGITDKDNPQMEFRFCSKCQGDFEYCTDHLGTHDHRLASDK